MPKTKEITPTEYAKWYGCFPTYIQRILRAEELGKLPFVVSAKKYSRFYTLEVPEDLTADSFKLIKK